MATFIDRMNTADALARLYAQGQVPAIILRDTLKCLGFDRIRIGNGHVSITIDGVPYSLRS